MRTLLVLTVLACCLVGNQGNTQLAMSPEEAGIEPITGDLSPWRAFGVDVGNFDQVWVTALNNGNIAFFKRGGDPQTPGVIGGSEFLLFDALGNQLTSAPVHGSFESDGEPTPYVDFAGTGAAWGAFTHGAHADRANGTGFVVHNQGQAAELFGLDHADEVGDEAFSLLQLFDNEGNPIGSSINAFGGLTGEPGAYRDIGAVILSNGDIVALGENRQFTDDFLDSIASDANEVVMGIILGRDGTVKHGPFAPHTGEDGIYLGGSSSAVFQNMTSFDGGFVIDYGSGIRWYNNDGTPRTPSQPDHADVEAEEVFPGSFFLMPANSGGRGDGMALASNGGDMVVKSVNIEEAGESIGVLIYYNTDGTVNQLVRFDDVNIDEEIPQVGRTFCDMDENGNVFVVWEDNRFGGGDHAQVFGRFFDAAGEPFGPSFPVFENWKSEPEFVDYGGLGQIPAGEQEQPRCALNGQAAGVISAANILPDQPGIIVDLSNAFDLVLTEATVRMFKNPFAEADVTEWALY